MENEIDIPNSGPSKSVNILVVDDDTTCLAIVAAILKSWKYQVVTVKHPNDALCILRIKGGSFDLVVSDVHMPDMNGFELQKQIDEEFKLPVVLMSADDKDGIIIKGLQSGAAFFIVKPVSRNDLKNIWQYAFAKKKGKTIIEEIGNADQQYTSDVEKACNENTLIPKTISPISEHSVENARSSSLDNEANELKIKSRLNEKRSAEKEDIKNVSAASKKARFVWTSSLHNHFLEAINSLGIERAGPTKILEVMNIPGLRRDHVASHLQKYRLFLRKVCESSSLIQSSAERSLVSSGQPSFLYRRSSISGLSPCLEYPKQGLQSSLNRKLSFSNYSTPGFGYGQSSLLYNQNFYKQPMIDITKSLYRANNSDYGSEPKNQLPNFPVYGNSSGGLGDGQQKCHMAPKCTLSGQKVITGYEKNGAFNNHNFNSNLNYGGLEKLGIFENNGGETTSADFISKNGGQHQSMSILPILSGNCGHYLAQFGVSSINEIQSLSNIKPTFADAPPVESTSQHNKSSGDGGESIDYLFGLLDNFSGSESNSCLQQFGEGDFSLTSQNQTNTSIQHRSSFSCVQQKDGEEGLSSAFSSTMEDNRPVDKQSLDQQHGGEELIPDFGIIGSPSDQYFASFDNNSWQLDDEDEDFLDSLLGPGEEAGDPGPGIN